MTDDHTSGTRDAVIDRASGLARTALAGGAITDCGGTLTQPQYHDLPLAVGFTGITITHEAGTGLHSVIIQAAKPAAPHT